MSRKLTGCRNCMVALGKESDGKITYEEPQAIKDLEEFSYNYTYAEGSNFADNQQNIYLKKPTGADIKLVFSDLKLKMEALLGGKIYYKGGLVTNTNDKAKAVALIFQETYSDGSYINKVFYNTKLSRDETSGKTEGEGFEFTPANIVGRAIPLENGDIEYRLDSSDPEVDKSKLDAWFTEVQFMDKTMDIPYKGYSSGEVTEISLSGITFDKSSKTFKGVPINTLKFTFKLDSAVQTATKSGSDWTFQAQG
ncbi:major tail protein [Clostridium cadaveris]|uniref:major tail protein n=1 Tax=Clostridium cadaveris TaxID=1529 RepID=UPI001F22BC6F|nr:major tail protein [Clostridium cadaveris]